MLGQHLPFDVSCAILPSAEVVQTLKRLRTICSTCPSQSTQVSDGTNEEDQQSVEDEDFEEDSCFWQSIPHGMMFDLRNWIKF